MSLEAAFCYRCIEQTRNMCLNDTCLNAYISLVTVWSEKLTASQIEFLDKRKFTS